MPRTRTVSDENILTATVALVSEQGVDRLTFASLSTYTGLSPATLVQRFGTKQQLLKAVTQHCLQSMVPTLNAARSENSSPLRAIIKAFGVMASVVTSAQSYANGQIFFYLALTDKETNTLLRNSTLASREKIRHLLDEAIRQKELIPCDTSALALTLQTAYEGAIMMWLIYQQDAVEAWVKQRVTEVIKPYVIK